MALDRGDHLGIAEGVGQPPHLKRELVVVDAARGVHGDDELELDRLARQRLARRHKAGKTRDRKDPDEPPAPPPSRDDQGSLMVGQ